MSDTDPYQYWSAQQIADASDCPLWAVQANWPLIANELALCEIYTPNVCVGVIGTTAIEGASTFQPVREAYYLGEPEPAETHRKTLPYWPYFGRGHLQLTHRSNYVKYSKLIAALWGLDPASINLEANPDQALEPAVAASVIALWFRDTRALPSESYPLGYSLREACEEQDWEWVRRLVYGGSDAAGSQRIAQIEADLGPPGGTVVSDLPVFNSGYPAISQNDQWSCAPTSTRWALSAWGRNPSEQWVENSMISEGVVSTAQGLLLATGIELAAWCNRHYAEFGFLASNQGLVSFDEIATEAATNKHPLLAGGRSWGHWTGVRGFDGTRILLANPASGYMGVTQTLSREQFNYLGSFSMVRLMHPGAESAGAVPPLPPDPADPFTPWFGKVGTGLLELMAADGTKPAQRSSTWLPLGVTPSDVETCYGENGTLYTWLLTVGRGFRTKAD